MNDSPPPDRLFFKIGDVAQIVGVKPHVLRYWETEFPALRPMKTRGAHRVYRRKDVELAMLVKQLVQEEGLTIAGAKRRLRELQHKRAPEADQAPPEPEQRVNLRADMLAIRRELHDLLGALDRILHPAPAAQGETTATVTAAVPSSVRLRGG